MNLPEVREDDGLGPRRYCTGCDCILTSYEEAACRSCEPRDEAKQTFVSIYRCQQCFGGPDDASLWEQITSHKIADK